MISNIDEGYIKFNAIWEKTLPLRFDTYKELNHFRQKMYKRNWIGAYTNGIGFGNISIRKGQIDQFYISGSKTGNLTELTERHYALVTDVFIKENRLNCKGESKRFG